MNTNDIPFYLKGFIVAAKDELGVDSSPLKIIDFILKNYGDTVLVSKEDQEKLLSAVLHDHEDHRTCKYCNFDENKGYFPAKRFDPSHYESEEVINTIGGGLQLDMDNKPAISVSIHTPSTTYLYGWGIKYCPMCGRKLEVNE